MNEAELIAIPIAFASTFSKAVEGKDGEWYISGPVCSLDEDYDNDQFTKSSVYKGLKTLFNLGAVVDYRHQFQKTGKGEYIIGEGVKFSEVDGVPWITVKLLKAQEWARDVWDNMKKGVKYGFSVQGVIKKRKGKKIEDAAFHMVTVDPIPKGFNHRKIVPGAIPDAYALAKSIEEGEVCETPWWDGLGMNEARIEAIERQLAEILKALHGEADEAHEEKHAKAEAHYREGTSKQCCGTCAHFDGQDGCSMVKGKIGADDLCDYYASAADEAGEEEEKAIVLDAEDIAKGYIGFDKLKQKIEAGGASAAEAEATAAKIGMHKYGKKKFERAAHEGKKMQGEKLAKAEDGDGEDGEEPCGCCDQCSGPGCGCCDKCQPLKKGVNAEARYTCPRCGHGLYCINCHKGAAKAEPAEKALLIDPAAIVKATTERVLKSFTTGDGVVAVGETGGAAERKQYLKGRPADASYYCEACERGCDGPKCPTCGGKAGKVSRHKKCVDIRALTKRAFQKAGVA